jgi:hypothetical protein
VFPGAPAKILFMIDIDMPKRSANALWVTLLLCLER